MGLIYRGGYDADIGYDIPASNVIFERFGWGK